MDLSGFRFDSSLWRWTLEPVDLRVTSLQTLLATFTEDWKYDYHPILLRQPDGTNGYLIRDPADKNGEPYYDPLTNWIYLQYRRGFYITIERQYREIFGPHPARLFYRSWQQPGEIIWVGICQVSAMWHSDERMFKGLQESVNEGGFYQSPKTAETIIVL